jgi:hypothetical protein
MRFSNRTLVVLGSVFILFAGACGKNPPSPIMIHPETHQVYYSEDSRLADPMEREIRDADTWRRLWEQITNLDTPPPSVDFSRQMLLLFNGGKMEAGDRVEIFRLQPERGEWVAWYRIIDEGVPGTESYPVQVVRVPNLTGRVRFQQFSGTLP